MHNASASAPPWLKPSGPTPGPTPVFWDSRACRSGSLRPWGKRNAICSSLSDLAPSHTRTAIGLGQTMSQPFIVALMTQLAEVAPDHVVLETGTGSGYQASILSY